MKRLVILLGALCCAVAIDAQATTLRLCMPDQPFKPYFKEDGSGRLQELMRRVGEQLSISFQEVSLPMLRCQMYLKNGEVDVAYSAYLPQRMEYGLYPMKSAVAGSTVSEQPDESRALAATHFQVYRLRGSKVSWDGQHFTGLDGQSVAVQLGVIPAAILRQSGVAVDEGSKSTDHNLAKLSKHRVAAVVAMEKDAQPIIDQQYSGEIETVPQPFTLTTVYLQVNREFYQRNKSLIDNIWDAIGKTRASPAYQRFVKQSQ